MGLFDRRFAGRVRETFPAASGPRTRMRAALPVFLTAVLACSPAFAGKRISPERIRFIQMGGDDCPPCREWRAVDLPRLQQSRAFSRIWFSYVVKSIRSPVPPAAHLPYDIQHLKAKLDYASGGRASSPHQVILVDDEVYDYWFGASGADEIEARIGALVNGTRYPYRRCIKRTGLKDRSCEISPAP
jgi:hypothetical protein